MSEHPSGGQHDDKTDPGGAAPDSPPRVLRVMVTGGSGFVGRSVVRELLRRGHVPVCLARDPDRLLRRLPESAQLRVETVRGALGRPRAVRSAIDGCDAVIHLVGIILQSWRQSFRKVHVEGTRAVVDAAVGAGVRRFVHMSALGARPGAASAYHRTKYEAEQLVRAAELDWTIFQPSIIHGPDGDFMRLMKLFAQPGALRVLLPAMPYFGAGDGRVQPVWVRDVACCMTAALTMPETVGRTYVIGGPDAYDWKRLYTTCARLIAGRPRRLMSVPLPLATLLAVTVMKTPLVPRLMKFDRGQVRMAQEDAVCDPGEVERTFGITLRSFEDALSRYADHIGAGC